MRQGRGEVRESLPGRMILWGAVPATAGQADFRLARRDEWGAHAPRVRFPAPSLETSVGGNGFDEGVEPDSRGRLCSPFQNRGSRCESAHSIAGGVWMETSGLIDGHLQFAKLIKPKVRTEYTYSKFQKFDVQSTITVDH